MITDCKYCGKDNNNGTNFCSRKCRTSWVREHNIKGRKKKVYGNYGILERELMLWGSEFSNECETQGSQSQNRGRESR
jgi:hypothetical protein